MATPESAAASTPANEEVKETAAEVLPPCPEVQYAELSNGEKYAYRIFNDDASKDPPSVLLLHGNQSASRCFREIAAHERLRKLKAISVDMRGFGKTSYNTELQNSHEELAGDLTLLLQQLKLSNMHVVGWSTAGAVAIILAAQQPQLVASIALLSSMGPSGFHMTKEGKDASERVRCANKDEIGRELGFFLQAYAANSYEPFLGFWDKVVWTSSEVSAERRKEFGEDVLDQRNLVDIAWLNHCFDAKPYVDKIKAKVLVIHGDRDVAITVSTAAEWGKVLPGATVKIINGGNHCLFYGPRDELCSALGDFMA